MKNNDGKLIFNKTIIKFRLLTVRWKFWAYMMDSYPKIYHWADRHLPIDTLPF